MTQPTYTIASFDAAQLHAEIIADAAIITVLLGINASGSSVTCIFAVDPLPTAEKTALDVLVAAHVVESYGFEKNYHETEYGKSNRIERETWWAKTDGAGNYSKRVEETIYGYAGGKSNTLLSETITTYDRSGNADGSPVIFDYTTKNLSGGKTAIVRGKR